MEATDTIILRHYGFLFMALESRGTITLTTASSLVSVDSAYGTEAVLALLEAAGYIDIDREAETVSMPVAN